MKNIKEAVSTGVFRLLSENNYGKFSTRQVEQLSVSSMIPSIITKKNQMNYTSIYYVIIN